MAGAPLEQTQGMAKKVKSSEPRGFSRLRRRFLSRELRGLAVLQEEVR